MKILITGANGQVGYEFVKIANAMVAGSISQHDIVCFDRAGLDITHPKQVDAVIVKEMPKIVINCAAYTAVDKAQIDKNTAFAINEAGPRHLALACKAIGAVLIHISSDYVFSGDKKEPYSETDSTGPGSVYGASKLAGEIAIADVLEQHIILRTAWVFGEHGNNFVKTMLRLGSERDALDVVGDQYGGPTSAKGIVDCCMAIVHQISVDIQHEDRWGTYHFSGSPYTSWHGFAEAIFRQAVDNERITKAPKVNCINTEQFPTAAKRPSNSQLNCKKLLYSFHIYPDNWPIALDHFLRSSSL